MSIVAVHGPYTFGSTASRGGGSAAPSVTAGGSVCVRILQLD